MRICKLSYISSCKQVFTKVNGPRHLDQSSAVIPLRFANILISPYGHAHWHILLSQRWESLLLLVMAHKLNLHTEQYCWDAPDARGWINIKALRADVCLHGRF